MKQQAISLVTAVMVLLVSDIASAEETHRVYKSKEEALSHFRVLDIDKSSSLNFSEWSGGGMPSADFDKLDRDDDNIIDQKEFLLAHPFPI